jgi:hypothetical protein
LAALATIAAIFAFFVGRDGIGPYDNNDGRGYIGFADQILAGSMFTSVPDLYTNQMPFSLFRIFGYPTIIAGVRLLAGSYWLELIVALQAGLAIAATYCIYSSVRQISGLYTLGVVCAVIFASSYLAFYVRYVLSDSIYISVTTIVVCWLAVTISTGRTLSKRCLLILGGSLAFLFLIREVTAILAFTMVPLVALSARRETTHKALQSVAVAFAPLLATYLVVMSWNYWRSGYPVITTAAMGAPLLEVAYAQRLSGIPMFVDDTLLDQTMSKYIKTASYSEILLAERDLLVVHGILSPEQADLSRRKYFQTWWRHPGVMWALTLGHIDFGRSALISPFFVTGSAVLRDWYPRYMRALFDLCMFVLPAGWIVAGLIFRRARAPSTLVAALASMSLGTLLFYSAIQTEPRYLLPITAPLFLVLAITMRALPLPRCYTTALKIRAGQRG